MKKRWIAMLLTLALCSSLLINAHAETITFSDVPANYWGYDTIMKMTEKGLFKGTTEPVNGVGTFAPEQPMTRAEFITVAMRAVYPVEALSFDTTKSPWWDDCHSLAVKMDILSYSELDSGNLNKPMSREEMAMIMVRCVAACGEKLMGRVDSSKIADYEQVGDYYKQYVLDCFSFGLLGGVDAKGTFKPQDTLKRAEAATALYRLVEKSVRLGAGLKDANNTGTQKPESTGSNKNNNVNTKPGTSGSSGHKEQWPWERAGAKQPADYTWAEFQVLSDNAQAAFAATFATEEAYDEWLLRVMPKEEDTPSYTEPTPVYPWENGGKKPSNYTLGEFNSLSEGEKEAFFEWFASPEAFEAWMEKAIEAETDESIYPWENGGKQPSEYTMEEFDALSGTLQEAFFEWFDTPLAFENWMSNAQ